ncbi:hypothetical protein ACIA8C_17535 [Nocardia sp. NPDC051321]
MCDSNRERGGSYDFGVARLSCSPRSSARSRRCPP